MTFFAHAIARPPEVATGSDFRVADGRVFRTLARTPGESLPPLAASFEEAYATLEALPRMFVEPDGSFVWVGETPSHWQIDGVLYDHAGRLRYVELKGWCPEEAFDRLAAACGAERVPLAFDLVEHGARLDDAEFRRYAGWRT